ncbi:rod shape-determining protein MreD [Sinanaerobacter sp. ZZT-01]|uniref:rod shape-determining protein MreD n=1 Tax=Sinanaerobacter sp. ZZT-01 TaxID=3111540 RepID=UPI002D76EA04|nr:rod shape-determining protein MreD [Sinanaerobacter sp. ZZT-01]WRR92614.1 rod shape-determining protein MreD [Sinanaerobacter sp. ZZT-01]
MKYGHSFILFLAAFLLQSTVLNHLSFFGVTPNLVLCLVIVLTFLYDEYPGIVGGLLFGLIQDLCFGEIIGIASLAYFAIGLSILYVKKLLYQDNVLSILFITISSTLGYYLIYWGVFFLFNGHYHFLYMAKILPISIIYNNIFTIFYYLIIGKTLEKNPKDRYV